MALLLLDPITRKRFQRFRRIKRGFYALLALLILIFISLLSEYVANSRPLAVSYNGRLFFPTWQFHKMTDFGQVDPEGYDDEQECNYRLLKKQWEGTKNWVLMPPIPWNPLENDFITEARPPHPPNKARGHYLGTDQQGRDVAARLLYGFRISVFFSIALVACGLVVGSIIGSMMGFLGGWFDLLMQRFIEIWSTLPRLYIIIIVSMFLVPNAIILLLILLCFEWIGITYYMRTEMYREKTREYCLAARSIGASPWRTVFRHLLPNCLTPLVTLAPFMVVGGIFALTSLDFLGYGLPPPTPSWGELIQQGLETANRDKLWVVLSPFFAISGTLILVTLIGESVREAFDPKQFARYE